MSVDNICSIETSWTFGVLPVVLICGVVVVLVLILCQVLCTILIARADGGTRLTFVHTDGSDVIHVPVYGRVRWVDVLVGTPLWYRKGLLLFFASFSIRYFR